MRNCRDDLWKPKQKKMLDCETHSSHITHFIVLFPAIKNLLMETFFFILHRNKMTKQFFLSYFIYSCRPSNKLNKRREEKKLSERMKCISN